MSKASPSINLLKTRSVLWDQFVDWSLNVGRLLVIITEIVALTMFIYRFSLDRQIIDLKDKITQEDIIVRSLKTNEKNYRDLQYRMQVENSLITTQEQQSEILREVISFVPQDVRLSTLSLTPQEITINANSASPSSLKKLVESLKKYELLDSISINNVTNNAASGLVTMNITAKLKVPER